MNQAQHQSSSSDERAQPGISQWLQTFRRECLEQFRRRSWDDLNPERWRYVKPHVFVKKRLPKTPPDWDTGVPILRSTGKAFEIRWASSQEAPAPTIPGLWVQSLVQACDPSGGTALHQKLQRPGWLDRMGHLHWGVLQRGVHVAVDPHQTITQPVVIVNRLDRKHSSVVVDVGAGSRVTVVARTIGGMQGLLGHARLVCSVGEGATVDFVSLQEAGCAAKVFEHHHFMLNKDARVEMTYVSLGGQLSRMEQMVSFLAPGSFARTNGLVFGAKDQRFDFNTVQDHGVDHSESVLFFRNVLAEQAKAVFRGDVCIDRGTQGVVANQINKNLLLSEHAEVATLPNLEIDTDDVSCGHGATVSTLSEDELFYLGCRGLRPQVAKKMIIRGFFSDVLDRMPKGHIRKRVEALLRKRLETV